MDERRQEILEVLQHNKGFIRIERWIEYGLLHNFRKILAEEIDECPDCKCSSFHIVGQYVYYSTLIRLQACAGCGLIYSDKRIDSKVIQSHFERAYKGEDYFVERRRRILEQIAVLTDLAAGQGSNILDVGGAKGHLLAMLKTRRADLHLVVNDLSEEACRYAAGQYGLRTICGDVNTLATIPDKFEVIIMSDVIYYEPDLRRLWNILPGLLAKNGSVIIRVPNKLLLIRLWQFMIHAINSRADTEMQDHIRFFNSEHLYIFSRRYLLARLKELGFTQITAIPSDLLAKSRRNFWHFLYFYFCKFLFMLSCGKLILTPSLLVIAKRSD